MTALKPFSFRKRMEASQSRSPPSPRALWHQNARCSPGFDGRSASHARISAALFSAAAVCASIFPFRDGASA